MKNRLLTITIREIKNSYKRFLSLLIMSFLGVAVFVGLRNTEGTLIASIDKYYKETNLYDIKIISTLGLTDNDINYFNKLGYNSYGIHSKDVFTFINNDTHVVKIIGLNDNINKILLNEGRYPKNNEEILVENNLLLSNNLKIGDCLAIDNDNSFKSHKYKIVGTITSPMYLLVGDTSIGRGNTNIGNGYVEYYAYINDNAFNMDYYTELYLKINNDYITSSDEYVDLINSKLEEINNIKSLREKERYNQVYNKYVEEINKNEEEGINKLNDAKTKLNTFKYELDKGYNKLLASKKELDDGKRQLENALSTLEDSEKKLNDGINKLNNAKEKLNDIENEINNKLQEYGLTIEDIITIDNLLNDKKVSIEELKHVFINSKYKSDIYKIIDYIYENELITKLDEYINSNSNDIKEIIIKNIPNNIDNYEETINFIKELDKDILRKEIFLNIIKSANNIEDIKKNIPNTLYNYDKIIEYLDKYSNTILDIKKLFDAVNQIIKGKEEINKNEKLLNDGKIKLEKGYQEYYLNEKKLKDGAKLYNKGYKDYQNSLNLYNSSIEEYFKNKLDFENKINEAKEKLKEIEMPEWYIYTRSDDSDYSGYLNVGESIKNLSRVFPTVFFLVAVFMSIMSMSRMALEDRLEIGTLKSLGFSSHHSLIKYIIYSMIATILGGILGGLFGFYFLTWFVYKMYDILYNIPFFKYHYDLLPLIIGIIIAIICITGTTILTIKKMIKEKPSSLLRPLAPSSGKKMLIEYLPIWKKVRFSNKITIRNIIRYKKRVILTITGITGCTVLLLSGYGIKDSIINIPDKQFSKVFNFDDIIYLDKEEDDLDKIFTNKHIKKRQDANIGSIKINNLSANLLAIKKDFDYNIIGLRDYKTNEKLKLIDNKVIITTKLSEKYHYKVGDKIEITDQFNKKYELEISGIAENYVGIYVYMSDNTYKNIYHDYKYNISYILLDNNKYENIVIKELIENEHVLSSVSRKATMENVNVMLKSLDSVVLILIVLSGLLSFVVLYNLSYINISERKREISTLKVLGFTYSEVDNYIIKENFIITIIGIIIGLILAKPFVNYIVDTLEMDMIKFIHIINFNSYLYTFIYMIIFTIVVSIIIHFTLKKINMIESLKTVE